MKKNKELSPELRQKCKSTADRFIEEIKKTCHAMIDADHITESPALLVKTALGYLEEHYKEIHGENDCNPGSSSDHIMKV